MMSVWPYAPTGVVKYDDDDNVRYDDDDDDDDVEMSVCPSWTERPWYKEKVTLETLFDGWNLGLHFFLIHEGFLPENTH